MGWHWKKAEISRNIQEGGMNVQFWVLSLVTAIYMIHAGYMDIREKKIYSFPCLLLNVMWCAYLLWNFKSNIYFLVGYWIIQIIVYIAFNHFHIWGAGDSDIFFLFGNVYLATIITINSNAVILGECIYLVIALSLSLIISWIECRFRKIKFDLKGRAAVVPGFSVMIVFLLVNRFLGGVTL